MVQDERMKNNLGSDVDNTETIHKLEVLTFLKKSVRLYGGGSSVESRSMKVGDS